VHEVDAAQPIGQAFAEVAEHYVESRKAIEHAAHDEPQRVQCGFDRKAEHGAVEPARHERLDHVVRRRVRVDVDGHVERLGRREDLPEFLVVEVLALRVRVHDRALEPEFAHAALELLGGGRGILWRDGGEPCEARRVGRDRRGELVVGCARECSARRGIEDLHARRSQRQDLQGDTRRIHVFDAPRAQVLKALGDGARALARIAEIVAHEAVEADVVRTLARQQIAVGRDEILGGERLFGGDTLEAQIGTQSSLSSRQLAGTGCGAGTVWRFSRATASMPIAMGTKHHK
jgi:hypothetical protein